MRFRHFSLISAIFLATVVPAVASTGDELAAFSYSSWAIPGALPVEGAPVESRVDRVWRVNFDTSKLSLGDATTAALEQRTQAVQYSEGYATRRKIHMIASYATLPLFVGQYITGDKLFDGDASDSVKSWHGVFAGGIAALFAVNTVTGVWNLMEARHDPNGKTRRLVHGLMMLGADAGFVATGMMAPDDDGEGGGSDKSAHRNVAIASMGVAAVSYVYMLVTR